MLGPIGSEIMKMFRLLSPDEIDKYIVREDERVVNSSMAANGEPMQFNDERPHLENQESKNKFPKDHQAKIIPINEEVGKKRVIDENFETVNYVEENTDSSKEQKHSSKPQYQEDTAPNSLASIGVLSASTIKEIEAKRRAEENRNKDSATVFLLKEREKMRQSKKRLTKQIAINMYKTNAAQEFKEDTDEDILDENYSNDLKGILVNKKHF